MKNLFTFLFMGIVSMITLSVFAQKGQVNEVKAVNNVYTYEKVNSGSSSMLSIQRKSTIPVIYSDKTTKLENLTSYTYTSSKPISKSISEAFGLKRTKALSNEIFLTHMFINNTGKVIAVRFLLKADTKITVGELEKLEDSIKKNVAFSLSERDKKLNGHLAPVTQSINMAKVADGSFAN